LHIGPPEEYICFLSDFAKETAITSDPSELSETAIKLFARFLSDLALETLIKEFARSEEGYKAGIHICCLQKRKKDT
jgi:hypothetical protein